MSGAKVARAVERKVRSSFAGTLGTVSRALMGAPAGSSVVSARPISLPAWRTSATNRTGLPVRARVLDGIAGAGVLPGVTVLARAPAARPGRGQPGDAEHGPHQRIVGDEPGDGVGRLGPERLIADHHGGRRAAAERPGHIEPE